MDPNLECCVSGCDGRPNQGLRFYQFPCHNPQISSIWEQRICQSSNIDFLNDRVCELHFDYRCKTGNECTLEEGSLPTLHLPNFGSLPSTSNEHIQISASRIEDPSYTISVDTLSHHCRFCLRRGLLYEVEASTYRSKSFSSLITLPPNVLPHNTQPNACLSCLKSIVIAHQLSRAAEHSNTIVQLLRQHPKQSKVVSYNNFFDMKSELAFCNLILANSLSIKLEFEIEGNMVCANEDYERKWVSTGDHTSPAAYGNTQNMVEKSICVTENQANFSRMYESISSDKQYQNEFHKSFAIGAEYTTDLSAEGIPDLSDSCVIMKNTDDKSKVMAWNNSDDSCAGDRQLNNEQSPESLSKAVYEQTYKCDLCKYTTNYKANLEIHKNLHLADNAEVQFYCQKCEKDFLLRRHFVRHNTIVHADDFTCKICEKPHASATKLAVHYSEHHHFQCDISSRDLRCGHRVRMLDQKQGQTTFTMMDKNTHWNENEGVNVCPICGWKNLSLHTFNAHLGKHVQSVKDSTIGSQELETLKTIPERNADDRYQCSECQKAFINKCDFIRHVRIHSNERPNKCIECPKTFKQKSKLDTHKRIHTNERPYKCTECLKTFKQKSNLDTHKRIHTDERPYKCTECSKTFNQKSNFDLHKRIHTNQKPYKCTECLKAFRFISNFNDHKRIHTNEKPYKCTECSKTFRSSSILSVHRRIHRNERPYKCTECSKSFNQKCSLDIHQRIHTNEKPYECTECSKTFSSNSTLCSHKTIHTNKRPFECTECPKTFSQNSGLSTHRRRMHTNERPYKCTECSKAFFRKGDLDIHKRIHTNERPYKCTECPKSFSSRGKLSTHKKIHTNGKPYKCTECSKTFSHKGNCDIHKRIHTDEKPYTCAECPKAFRFISNFNDHKRIHTNERPYKCAECPKAFITKDRRDRHKRIHTNEKPYKCSECSKTFSDKSNFDTHRRIHLKERPYKCTECPKSFSSKSKLSTHTRIHTNERPYKCTGCPKAFYTKGLCDRHKRIHATEKPYKCTECLKSFTDKSNFDRHKIIHTNERPYKCAECPKTFIQQTSLSRHKRIHTNERPY